MGSTLAKPSLRPPFHLLAGAGPTTSRAPSLPSSSLSIPSPPSFMVDYLVDRLGYPKDKALAASKPLLRVTSPEKPDAVLDFLRRRAGLSIPQLHRFVRCRPSILNADVPSNLLPKLSLFHSLLSDVGASPDDLPSKDLAALVSTCASAFGYSAARLGPALDFLRSLLAGDNRKAASALRRCPRLLTNDPKKVLARNLAVLRRRSLDVAALVEKAPVVLILSPERLDSTFRIVEKELNIDNASVDGYFDAVYVGTSMSEEAFKNKLGMLRSYGFSNAELFTLIRRAPPFFRLTDEHMKKKLEFFIRTLGYTPQSLLWNTWQLLFSLETKLLPRYELLRGLQSRKLLPGDFKYAKAFVMPQERFNQEYVYKFKDGSGSDLVESYMNSPAFRKSSPEDDSGSI
ncbi:putative transcription termination factor MTERF15, mitochondrial [Cocos nucifera]|nr:putative transcription termination factor MTERF15, mitochondrial [Cocos nucifera]